MRNYDDDIERSRRIMRRKGRQKFNPNSPLITVVRIERRDNPKRGAWWEPPLIGGPEDTLIFPAWLFQQEHHLGDINDMPNIMKDSPQMAKHWTAHYYSAFLDLDQCDKWLPVPEMRAAVYDVPETCVKLYSIATDRVLFGSVQVGFMLDFATVVRELTREEFVR